MLKFLIVFSLGVGAVLLWQRYRTTPYYKVFEDIKTRVGNSLVSLGKNMGSQKKPLEREREVLTPLNLVEEVTVTKVDNEVNQVEPDESSNPTKERESA